MRTTNIVRTAIQSLTLFFGGGGILAKTVSLHLQLRFGLTRTRTRRLPSETAARRRRLEPIQAEGVLCGGVSEDYVRVVEHVEAVQRQRVEFEVVQWELGVDVEADVCGQGAREVLE